MNARNWSLGIGMLLLAAAGCDGGAAGDDVGGSAQDFTLQYCVADDECKEGHACLPMEADAAGSRKGVCLPQPTAEGGGGSGSGVSVPAGACFAETWGDPAACQPGVDWAQRAVDSCKDRGATLVDLHVLLSCNGLPGGAIFTCCRFGDAPVDPPPQPECVELPFPGLGPDGRMPDPKQMADDQCRALGMELRDVRPADPDEADRAMTWIATCCGPVVEPPPPPPPGECIEMPVPGGPGMDPKEMAWRLCSDRNLVLADLRPARTDAAGQVDEWMAVCCGDVPVEPPPPDPGACARIPVKVDPTSPDPAQGDPKMVAYRQCQAMGLELRDLEPGWADPTGMVREWIATCCGPVVEPPPPPPPGECIEMPVPGGPGMDPKEMAWRLCSGRNLVLADLRPGRTDASGQVYQWMAVCCGDVPVEPPPPDPGACTRVPVKVDPTSPDPVQGDPRMAADLQCKAMGLYLQDLQPGWTDPAGMVREWIATCCGPVVEPPPPPPPADGCQEMRMTFDCRSSWDWKDALYQRCGAAGGEIRDLQASECGPDGQGVARAACCTGPVVPPPEPPPEDPGCASRAVLTIGDGTCDAARDFQGEADLQCRIIGGRLQDVQVRHACDDGTVGAVIATCCVG
ncbi:hypothetical protein KBD49_10480 [Myxococcota bacterium]|nr:hypothetical protein [Myxococcota bacterium]